MSQLNLNKKTRIVVPVSINSLFIAVLSLIFLILTSLCLSTQILIFGHVLLSSWTFSFGIASSAISLIFVVCVVEYLRVPARRDFDFLAFLLNFLWWNVILILGNSLIAFFFLIELLASLFLVVFVVTETLANDGRYGQSVSRDSFSFESVSFLFWTSLVSSLLLFLSLLFFIFSLASADWFVLELLLITNSMPIRFSYFFVVGTFFITFTFVKLGLPPFFLWKLVFFQGLPSRFLFFYVSIFFAMLFSTLFTFFLFCYIEFLVPLTPLFFLFWMISLLIVQPILIETFYLKLFLAVSSVINANLLFLIVVNSQFCVNWF